MERCEELRLIELARINPVVGASEASFSILTRLVQRILGVPAAAITLIDRDTQYLKAKQGFDVSCTPRSDAVCDIVVRSGKPLIIGDMQKDIRVASNPAVTGPMGLRAYAGAPLTTQAGYHLGALCGLDTEPRSFSSDQIDILTSLASLASDLLELRAEADHDFLTKALNRRGFEAVLHRELRANGDSGPPMTLAMMDLDHFKSVNDTYGHPVGDRVLRALAEMINANLRKNDYLARMGGEEFAVLLTNTTLEDAFAVVDRIRASVASFRMAEFPDLSLTVSVGLADMSKRDKDFAALMREADAAVYMAKSRGRNLTIALPHSKPRLVENLSRIQ